MKRTDIHPIDCHDPCCEPWRAEAPERLTSLDVIALQMIGGFLLGLLLCEIYALVAHGAHVTVLFGGQG